MKQVRSVVLNGITVFGYEGEYVFEKIHSTGDFYEIGILTDWTEYLKSVRTVFDVGANLGNHSLYWAMSIPGVQVYSFEPFPDNYRLLKKNAEANFPSSIHVEKVCVGENDGYTSLLSFDESNYGATAFSTDISEKGEIRVVSLDSFCEINRVDFVDFVKIDTEGFELSVLRGAVKTIKKYHPDLWIECGADSVIQVIDMLRPEGYVISEVEGCNILLLNTSRHKHVKEVTSETFLRNSFTFLLKMYYFHDLYEVEKKTLTEKDQIVDELQKKIFYWKIKMNA